MIAPDSVGEILRTYAKHGWILRRVLLSEKSLAMPHEAFGGAEIVPSDIDAAWFSRPPKPGGVAWELRHLSTTPYALVEKIDDGSPDFEASLTAVESRLRDAAYSLDKRLSHLQT